MYTQCANMCPSAIGDKMYKQRTVARLMAWTVYYMHVVYNYFYCSDCVFNSVIVLWPAFGFIFTSAPHLFVSRAGANGLQYSFIFFWKFY